MESLTNDLYTEAKKIIEEIEESSAKKQARIDSTRDVIVGVNKRRSH